MARRMILDESENEHQLSRRLVSEDGRIEIGMYAVLYGVRLRAGYTDRPVCEIDWCMGSDMRAFELLYYRLKWHVEDSEGDPFTQLPSVSEKKPVDQDLAFLKEINTILPPWSMKRYKNDKNELLKSKISDN